MRKDEKFSFRWGVPILDKGTTTVPNFFFDSYIEAGATRTEFLAILHLARYQYETPNSECRPSVGVVAKQMGYYDRKGLQLVLAKMEKKGLLVKHFRTGQATIYDFSVLSKKVLAINASR